MREEDWLDEYACDDAENCGGDERDGSGVQGDWPEQVTIRSARTTREQARPDHQPDT